MKALLPRLLLSLAFVPLCISAQPTQSGKLGQFEVEVTERYRAQIKDVRKLREQPAYADTTLEKLPVRYRIVPSSVEVRFNPEPLSAARIARVQVPSIFRGKVRAGYGLYNTPLLEAYYNSTRSSQRSFGFYGRHFSTQKGVPDLVYEDNGMSRNALGGHYRRFFRQFTLGGSLDFSANKQSFYGLSQDLPGFQDSALEEAPFIWRRKFALAADLREANAQALGWWEAGRLAYQNYSDNYRSAENDLTWHSRFLIPAGDQSLNLELNAAYFATRYDSLFRGALPSQNYEQGTFQVQIRPHISLYRGNFAFDFGLNLYQLSRNDNRESSSNSSVFFFPDLRVTYQLVPEVLSARGGVKGWVDRNTYRELSEANPFLLPGQDHLPTQNTDVYLGLSGRTSAQSTFDLQGGFRFAADRALFYRDPFHYLDSVSYGMSLRYGNVAQWYLQGQWQWVVSTQWRLLAEATLRSLDARGEEEAWHMPNFTGQLSGNYRWAEKIELGLALQAVGSRPAFSAEANPEREATLGSYLNGTLDLRYHYNDRLSAFLEVRNLLAQRYELYLGFPNQQINFLLGFDYRF